MMFRRRSRSINQEAYWKLEVVPVCNQPRSTGRIHGARYRETDALTDPLGFYTRSFGASHIYIFPAPGSHSGQEAPRVTSAAPLNGGLAARPPDQERLLSHCFVTHHEAAIRHPPAVITPTETPEPSLFSSCHICLLSAITSSTHHNQEPKEA